MIGPVISANWKTALSVRVRSPAARRSILPIFPPRSRTGGSRSSRRRKVPIPRRGILPIAEMEKQAILGAIEFLHGDKLEAARLLGIGKTTLYRKLKEYGALQ